MKKTLLLGVCSLALAACRPDPDPPQPVDDDLAGSISRPQNNYGSDGDFLVAQTSFPSPLYTGRNVEIFHAQGANAAVPTLFFSHAFGGSQPSFYQGLLDFVASKGYAIVFAPYPTNGVTVQERYDVLWESFKLAAQNYPDIIDTQKVGFIGHSFGGGACFSLAYKGFVEEGWGEQGRIIFPMAQWYSYDLTESQLASFPENTKMIVQVYDDDDVNGSPDGDRHLRKHQYR